MGRIFRRCGILPRCFVMAQASPIGIASDAAKPHEAKLRGDPIPAAPCKQRKSHTEAPSCREFSTGFTGWTRFLGDAASSRVPVGEGPACRGRGKKSRAKFATSAKNFPRRYTFGGATSCRAFSNAEKFSAETQDSQRVFRQDLQDGQDLWGFRRRGRRESEEFRTFRRGYHGNGFRRLTPWIQILRATGQNETLKPMESRLRQTLKKGNSVPRGRGGITNGRKKGCEKKISAKNQGIFGDSGESVKGTDPVNSRRRESKFHTEMREAQRGFGHRIYRMDRILGDAVSSRGSAGVRWLGSWVVR